MPKKLTGIPSVDVDAVRQRLHYMALEPPPRCYLDTGDEKLNGVWGHPKLGIAYGKLLEVAGNPSNGKTATAMDLIAMAQNDGAYTGWTDAENSYDDAWAAKRGVDNAKLHLIQPFVGIFPKKVEVDKNTGKQKFIMEDQPRLSTAEELCAAQEQMMAELYHADPKGKQFWCVDSVTALLTDDEAAGGVTEQNMRTKLSLASFLSRLLRRWIGIAQAYNATILFINQLRIDPNTYFGNPETTTGGKALKFYCHVRNRMQTTEGGRIVQSTGGGLIGLKGEIRNYKNKAGGLQGEKCPYKIYFNGPSRYGNQILRKAKKKAAKKP